MATTSRPEVLNPRDEADLIEIVTAALSRETTLEVVGNGTKRCLGRPVRAAKLVTTAGLSGVTLYEPSELCLTAWAGTPMREIIALLDDNNQEFAFEPIDYSRLYARDRKAGLSTDGGALNPALGATIGGQIAINASGPRRIKAGAARDSVLGFRAISGRGELFKSGGRVMKNVTGYDLSKLMTGSYGTLGIMSEITLKVMPKAPCELTILITGLDDDVAVRLLCEASGLPLDCSALAHLPEGLAGITPATNVSALRLEGPDVSIKSRARDLAAHFKDCGGGFETLMTQASRKFWNDLRDAGPVVCAGDDMQIWRLSTTPSMGAAVVAQIKNADVPVRSCLYDWAGGLIWLALEPASNAHAVLIREALKGPGGHATLVRASCAVRSEVDVFQPQPKALAALSERVAAAFDPKHILNPGRLRAVAD